MSNYGTLLLSKVIETNDVGALARHNIAADHFKVDADRKAYEFIRDYAEQNRGQAPSYATVTENVPNFIYMPQVSDSYSYLTKRLMNDVASVEIHDFLTRPDGLQSLWNEYQNNPAELIDKLKEKFDNIKYRTDVREKIGTDIKRDYETYWNEYERRKSGDSFKTWKSKFSKIGEYVSGNMYVVYGKSGRGKSIITMEDAIEAAIQGANVLIWSMEMPAFEIMTRIYVSLSGRKGLTTVNFDGVDFNGGFDANDVRKGKLADEFESAYRFFLENLNSEIEGNITVRAVDHPDFSNRSLRQLEADILQSKADFVVIDPFYYLDYEKNVDNTTGGAASETSKKLRRLTGRMKVVTIAITQADEGNEETDEEGTRELVLPDRKDVSKTKQLLQDAYLLIAVDTDYKQGRGLVGLNKGRDGGEGDYDEIIYIPQVGIVRQIETGTGSIEQFI